jgi:hypothetical protein
MLHVLDGTAGGAAAVRAEHRRAVVTLTIGDGYRGPWEKLCRTSWLGYGARHGYDIIQITGKLDTSPFAEARSPAWQKCLILQQPWAAQYQRIVFMDCDIVITGRALDITESVPDPARIGACASGSQMSGAARQIYLERTSGTVVDPVDADPAWQRAAGAVVRDLAARPAGAAQRPLQLEHARSPYPALPAGTGRADQPA